MAGTWATDRFEPAAEPLRRYVDKHRKLDGEPLHLALVYEPGPGRDANHLYLLEVIGRLAAAAGSLDREWFEVSFGPASGFAFPAPDQELHLILTNPTEFALAVQEDWPTARDVVAAVRSGDFRVLHSDDTGNRLLSELRTATAGQAVCG